MKTPNTLLRLLPSLDTTREAQMRKACAFYACMEGSRKKQRGQHLSRKHFTCVILNLYLHLNNFVISFFFANGIFTSKAAKFMCCAYFRNKESLASAVPNPPVQNHDLWTLVASNEISRKYRKMANDSFLLYILIPALTW